MASALENAIKDLQDQQNVVDHLVIDSNAVPIRTTMDASKATEYAGLASNLTKEMKKTIRQLRYDDELVDFSLVSSKQTINTTLDKEFINLVVQKNA